MHAGVTQRPNNSMNVGAMNVVREQKSRARSRFVLRRQELTTAKPLHWLRNLSLYYNFRRNHLLTIANIGHVMMIVISHVGRNMTQD